ncbi:MAG TPA: ribonuclease E inhibitor RraB [Dongiaceae bacterium]|nr:ribonuclease E inhibitor RraB [Dongiaceae bacterium]
MSDDRSQNEDVIAVLIENGDALDQPRPIEHWAYFPTEEGRARFIAYIEPRYANIACSLNPMSAGKEYGVTFSHTGTPDADSITEITSALSLAAESCGGDYDGWETQVIR